jgi:subtilisin family serine protease
LYAQEVYWVTFDQKDTSFSIQKPELYLSQKALARRQKFGISIQPSDLPVARYYLDQLRASGFVVLCKSNWQNAAAIVVQHKSDLQRLQQFSFIKQTKALGAYAKAPKGDKKEININEMLTALDAQKNPHKPKRHQHLYGKSKTQVTMLGTDVLHAKGFWGEGIDIAVIDAGFNNADTLPVFKQLRDEHRIMATYDFVEHNSNVFDDDDHGLAVLSCMAGSIPYEYMGTAPAANYYLLRTEIAQTEMPVEEAYWTAAIEYADSVGVDLVNSSLGYNEFDDNRYSYTARDLDGKTALISKAAAMAVQKGIVVVVSAGNEGDEDWRLISVPADVKNVITVGGVDASGAYVAFSSLGASKHRNIKPDVMAQGDNVWVASSRGVIYQGDGTSYSSPLMAGAIACLMQAYSSLTPYQLMNILHQSASQYNQPDRYLGYGIPDLKLADALLAKHTADTIIDVRVLGNRIHLAYYSATALQFGVVVKDASGNTLLQETVKPENNGSDRIQLKKIKHFKKGKYSLQLVGDPNVQTFEFNH